MPKFFEAILDATDLKMQEDEAVYIMGLGVPDPKAIFGTTTGLQAKYGQSRVLDMPTSENAMTGVAIGSAIVGMRPIMTHQRVDFFLLALDQLINNAAKWHYMFGGQMSVPLVIRLIVGRGWGQGPQHSQTLHSLFAHVPGLKVVAPSNPYDAKGLLISSIEDNNPVIFIEHRWLHGIEGPVPSGKYTVPLGKAKIVSEGSDITVIASSHMTLEAFKALQFLKEEGVSAELVDLRSLKPLDEETILTSVRKTGRALVLDDDWKSCGFAAEILALLTEKAFKDLKAAPRRLTYPDRLSPTSWSLANHYYPTALDIVCSALEMLEKPVRARAFMEKLLHSKQHIPLDVPDKSFTGPF